MEFQEKVIIFGGSFDPVHTGHIFVAKNALKMLNADKLFFVPCKNHPNNKKLYSTDQQRCEMLNLAIANIDQFYLSMFEIENKNNVSYTIDTINYFKKKFPNAELFLLIGYDQLINFKNWKDYQNILKQTKLICHARDKQKINIDFDVLFINKKINVSSTLVREKPKKWYLCKDVLEYINENGLYAVNRLKNVMSDYRLAHSIRVANLAKELCTNFKNNKLTKQAYVAGIYHDYAKEIDKKIQNSFWTKLKIKMFNFPSWKTIHGPYGAYLVKKNFFINDKDVLIAIKNHTVPKELTLLTKIIYCADKLDIRHDGVIDNHKQIYQNCMKDIDLGFNMIIDQEKKKYGEN